MRIVVFVTNANREAVLLAPCLKPPPSVNPAKAMQTVATKATSVSVHHRDVVVCKPVFLTSAVLLARAVKSWMESGNALRRVVSAPQSPARRKQSVAPERVVRAVSANPLWSNLRRCFASPASTTVSAAPTLFAGPTLLEPPARCPVPAICSALRATHAKRWPAVHSDNVSRPPMSAPVKKTQTVMQSTNVKKVPVNSPVAADSTSLVIRKHNPVLKDTPVSNSTVRLNCVVYRSAA